MSKKDKIVIGVLSVIVIIIISTFLVYNYIRKNRASTNTTDYIDMNINTDDDDEKIDWSKYENVDYELSKSINITSEGVYNLTGEISDGLITINTKGNVKLVLNNVNIKNSSGPAIFVKEAEDVVIELKEGSENYLKDGSKYTGYEADEVGTIMSHDDLTLQGNGKLEVKSNLEDAIVSKDDLKIISGVYVINSKDDAIRGKDSVYILDGEFDITSGADGIKSTNDTDVEKGFIKIENGTFNINASNDGIQAETKLLIENGTFNITTGGGSTNSSTGNSWGRWGTSTKSIDSSSAKGIKAGDNIVINNGTFNLNTSDDAIHSNNYIGIKNGNFLVESGDDGVHADEELIIDGGVIKIGKSYEGLEALKITINGGNINVTSSDDGINVAGGNDSSSQGGRPGENNYGSSSGALLTINGGEIYVDASGDGLDANGSIYIKGGTTIVYGPTNSGNGALDYDGVFEVTGGTLLAGGDSGMMQGVSNSSTIYSVSIVFNSNITSSDTITIVDSNNNEVISYNSSKNYNSLVVASPSLRKGDTYSIKVNGNNYSDFIISNIVTNVGTSGGMNRGQGGPGGRGPGGYGR